jgi:hypothetical protein
MWWTRWPQEAGFTASAVALFACCGYSIVTGLLLAEVTINVMASQARSLHFGP